MKKQRGGRIVKPSDAIYCAPAGEKGRGIFAGRHILKGSLIEECELIYLQKKEILMIEKTEVDNFLYRWRGGGAVLPLGFGTLYNYSRHANAEWKNDYKNRRMFLLAKRDIKKDEEITVNYNLEELWFPVVENV